MKFKSRIYKDIIVEGNRRVLLEKQDYEEMFNDIIKIYNTIKLILDDVENTDDEFFLKMIKETVSFHLEDAIRLQIKNVRSVCKRGEAPVDANGVQGVRKEAPDMVLWALRYFKIKDYIRLITLAHQTICFAEDDAPDSIEVAKRIRDIAVEAMNKYVKKLTRINTKFEQFIIRNPDDEHEAMKADRAIEAATDWIYKDSGSKLSHYVGMVGVHVIQNTRFTDQWYTDIEEVWRAAEAAWQARMDEVKSVIPNDMTVGATVIMKFPDGKSWINLNKPYCDLEGKAMGHCGNNQGRSTSSETVLSLRQEVKMPDGRMGGKPYLTFILDSNGMLGETKTRFNEKPGKEWHSYILALLKLPMIKGVKGGGYAPDRNFFMRELTYEDQVDLFSTRPDLFNETDKNNLVKMMKEKGLTPVQESRILKRKLIR